MPEGVNSRDLRAVRTLYFLYYAGYAIFTVFVNVYYRQIGLSGTQIGWIGTFAPLVGILAGPLWGLASDRSGRPRLVMALAVGGSILAMAGLSATRQFGWLLALAAGWFLFNSTLFPMIDAATLAALGEHSAQYGRQRVFGSFGYIIIALGGGLVLERAGLEAMFPMYYGIMLVMLFATRLLPARRAQEQEHASLGAGLRALVRQPAWLLFTLAMLPLWMAANGMYTFLPVYLRDMGAGPALIGTSTSLLTLSELPFMLFSGWILRKVGLRRMLLLAFVFYALRMFFYSLIPSPAWAIPVAFLHGPSFGLFWVAAIITVNELAPAGMKNTAQTLYLATINLAGVVSAAWSGWLYDTLGGAALFRVYAVLCLVGLAVFVAGRKGRKTGS